MISITDQYYMIKQCDIKQNRFKGSHRDKDFDGALLTAYLYVAMYHCYHTKKERTDPGLLLGAS